MSIERWIEVTIFYIYGALQWKEMMTCIGLSGKLLCL